jgi:DNA (cytosine-5)-methyltransferase 1
MTSHLNYGSVCSGIEAASVAWEPLGMKAAWFSEIEAYPCSLLKYRYPAVPNLGDMRLIARAILTGDVTAPDVLVGGTPCQAFSLAGLREALDDERGQLTLTYMRLLDAIDFIRGRSGLPPAIAVWENVPGVLSTKDNAFGCFLAGLAGEDEPLQPAGKKWSLAGCVFGPKRAVAWRTLDAQYTGLAQQRKRVFVVASARKGFDPSAVLFEFDGVRRDSAPRREPGQEAAGTLASRTGAGGFPGTDEACSGYVQPVASTGDVSHCLNAGGMGRLDYETETLVTQAYGFQPRIARNGRGDMGEVASALTSQAGETGKGDAAPCVAVCVTGEITHTLKADGFDASEDGTGRGQPITPHGFAVRRLMPVECERLQGFPDDYTLVPHRGKPAADGPRYKAIGNSMAVPVMHWIGKRIQQYLNNELGRGFL